MTHSHEEQAAWRHFAPNALVTLAYVYAALFLVLFLPGNLSLDSLEQYEQALAGVFNDHHPPLMAVSLRLLMRAGLGIQTLITLQLLAGSVGVHCLLRATAALFSTRQRAAQNRLGEALVLLLLVSPLTPLLFHLTTFSKDSWFLVALLWSATSLLWLLDVSNSRVRPEVALPMLLVSVIAMVLSRHNGIALLPVLAVILLLRRPFAPLRNALVVGSGLIFLFASSQALYAVFDVERRYLHLNSRMWYDLFTLCDVDRDPGSCRDRLTQTSAAERQDAFLRLNEALFDDWVEAVAAHPIALARSKVGTFAVTLNLGTPPHDYFQARNHPGFGRYGLEREPTYAALRESLIRFTNRPAHLPLLESLLGGHTVWFALCVLGTGVLAWTSWQRRSLDTRFGLFALPLAYYLSYVPLFTVGDFRYLYPATAFGQIVALAWVIARFPRQPDGKRGTGARA